MPTPTEAALSKITPERLERHFASLKMAMQKLQEHQALSERLRAERDAEFATFQNIPKPWESRSHSPEEVAAAAKAGPLLTRLAQEQLRLGASDCAISIRSPQGGASRACARFRVDGAMSEPMDAGGGEELCQEILSSFAFFGGSGASFPHIPCGAALEFDMELQSWKFRLHCEPVYPEGVEMILRAMPTPKLSEQ